MRTAEDWIIFVESTDAVEWTKRLRDVEGLIKEIQSDALDEAAQICDERYMYHMAATSLNAADREGSKTASHCRKKILELKPSDVCLHEWKARRIDERPDNELLDVCVKCGEANQERGVYTV